ncbi:hypothetical protein H4582DRAFT_2073751 [Lactarius indigo]|nr:hypothetical protein H4582DRAFT_2073751 [Lactarius indigo]
MSDFENLDDDFDDDFDLIDDTPPGLFPPDSGSVPNGDDEDDNGLGIQYMPKPPLRSRPLIDFSARRSTVDTDLDFSAAAAFPPPRSHMSGSTLRSSLHPSTAPSFSRKTSLGSAPLARQLRLPPDAIAALTDSELLHNPQYRKLRRDHDHLASVLTTYVERELAEFRTAKSESLGSDIYQAVPRSVNSCHVDSRGTDSRASSLGPSDSASQQTRTDVMKDKAIEDLLESVEPPPMRPEFLPKTVLWDFKDCETDKSQGDIITDKNKSRPKLSLAIRRPNGTKISNAELSNMRRSAEMIVQKLINFVNSDPRSACAGAPKARTKTFIKKYFTAEHYRAVLDLEAEQKLLRLCSAHWKADAFITQVFLQRSKEKAMAAMNAAPATSPQSNLSPEPPTAFVPQIQEVAPMNLTKRALELSPGPKSPSASHAQKRNKDNHVPAVSGQKTIGSRGPLNQNQRPAARKITPTFLNRTKMTCAEPAPTSLRLLHVDPSVDNLVATLTSEFPSLTNAPRLLYSMSAQSSFKEGKPSEQVATLLEHVQFADPCSPDIDEDNMCQGWGHYQFTAGGISPASSLTSWEKVGSVATAFKLVAAAIKTCQEARSMCSNAGMPKTSGFISDAYLEKILECLESCWVGAGGVFTSSQNRVPLPTTPSYRDVAMSPPPRGPVIRIKRPALPADVATSKIPEVPTGTDSTTQPPATTEPTEPSVGLDEGAQASAASLKLLQVSELLAWFGDNKLSAPKWKRKDDLVDAIVKSPELAHISESTVKEIIEKRKAKKGPPKPLAA